jgi:hypothetical protein
MTQAANLVTFPHETDNNFWISTYCEACRPISAKLTKKYDVPYN